MRIIDDEHGTRSARACWVKARSLRAHAIACPIVSSSFMIWPSASRHRRAWPARLSGWLYGSARVLLTVSGDGTAAGPLLPGTISFMAARTQNRP
ncbi:hypothetical protein E1287_17370 [Actinomadura sp. KC06]|uniref:hypothetical protein n=1 Tax=Actinomadura sp. KC06 TaxID=2530369 RepID=UPI0010528E09|nr:hypothetical protein [Actinomadura sp. KC06]TDD34253.1 hypothetical protein E1287_17370 [Actinomadura sp. KC06]